MTISTEDLYMAVHSVAEIADILLTQYEDQSCLKGIAEDVRAKFLAEHLAGIGKRVATAERLLAAYAERKPEDSLWQGAQYVVGMVRDGYDHLAKRAPQ